MPGQTRAWLSHPSLGALWSTVRTRLERNRLTPAGTVTVTLDESGADRLGGLLHRTLRPGSQRVSLGALDGALRVSAAKSGLGAVVAELTGSPLVDRSAVRESSQASWAKVWALLDAGLSATGLAQAPWVALYLDGVHRSGVLTRAGMDAATEAAAHAVSVIDVLSSAGVLVPADGPAPPEPRWELAELASTATGDAHALDGGLAASLVLRAGAAALRVPAPESAAGRRELWALLSVTPDLVSGTALVWGLRPPGEDAWSAMMRIRSELGVVTHLTLQELRDAGHDVTLAAAGTTVWVCENPQVLQAAARGKVPGPLVCVSGNPSAAGWLLVRRLLDGGASLRYHGDFDWPGLGIAGRLVTAGASPWRMSAADYLSAVSALPAGSRLALTGDPVDAAWDPDLTVTMTRTGVAVHEEELLADLLADLIA